MTTNNDTRAVDFDWNANNMQLVTLTCKDHRSLRWMTKHLRERSLHFVSDDRECPCPLASLVVVSVDG